MTMFFDIFSMFACIFRSYGALKSQGHHIFPLLFFIDENSSESCMSMLPFIFTFPMRSQKVL